MHRAWNKVDPVKIYWLSCILFGLSTSIFDALYALHLRALGLREDIIGYIFGSGSAVMAVTLILMIKISRRLSPGDMLKWSTALFAVCMFIFPFLQTFPAHAVNFCICSAGSAIMTSTGSAAMLEHVQPKDRTYFFSFYFIVFLLSSAVGTLFIAVIHYYVPSNDGIKPYTGELIVSGVLAIAMAVARYLIKFSELLNSDAGISEVKGNSSFSNSIFYFTFALSLFTGASAVLSIRFVSLLLVERLNLTIDQTLLWLTAERVISFLTLLFLVPRLKSGNPYLMSAALMGLSALFLAGASFSLVPVVFGLLYLGRQVTHYSQQPLLEQIAFEDIVATERAQAGFVRRLGLFLGGSLGAFLYGPLIAEGAAMWAMLLASAFALLAAVAYALRLVGILQTAH